MSASAANALLAAERESLKTNIPEFRAGDSVRVHAKIIEGSKERIQIFEGVVIRRHGGNKLNASFTVRKVSYNVGVERTFLLHSPRIEKIEVVSRGHVRRSKLFYLRELRGKSARIKKSVDYRFLATTEPAPEQTASEQAAAEASPVEATKAHADQAPADEKKSAGKKAAGKKKENE